MRRPERLTSVTFAAVIGCAISAHAQTIQGEYCPDGTCRAKVGGYGFYQPKWRRWPSAPATLPPPNIKERLIPTPPIYIPDELPPTTELPEPEETVPSAKSKAQSPRDQEIFLPNGVDIPLDPPEENEVDLPELPRDLRSDKEEANPFDEPHSFDTEALEPSGAIFPGQEQGSATASGFELLPPEVQRQKITLSRPDNAKLDRAVTIVQTSAVMPEVIQLSEHREPDLIQISAERALKRGRLPVPSEIEHPQALRLLPSESVKVAARLSVPMNSPTEVGAAAKNPHVDENVGDALKPSPNRLRIQADPPPVQSEWRPIRAGRDASSNRVNPLRGR